MLGDRKPFSIIAGIVVVLTILLVIYLSWAFVNIIILSLFGAYVLYPLEKTLRNITRIKNRQVTAILTIGFVVLVFSAIFINVIFVLGNELSGLTRITQTDVNQMIDDGMRLVGDYIPGSILENMKTRLTGSASDAIVFIIDLAQNLVLDFISNITFFAIGLVVVAFLIYYLLIDGENIFQVFLGIIPENRVDVIREFLDHLDRIYNSLFNVYLIVCVLTGIIGAIGLMLIGVPYPVMWGSVIAIMALLPIVGPGTFYIPATAYYLLAGDPVRAVVLLIFGWVFLDAVPGNVIRPRLMMQHGNIHPIITLLSFTAPLFVIGAMGIIIGPAAFGLVLAIYRTYVGSKQPEKELNKMSEDMVIEGAS